LLLIWLPVAAVTGVRGADLQQAVALSRFDRTVAYLAEASPQERSEFAATALAELAAVYVAEAGLARSQASEREGDARARLLGWSVAVDHYADQVMLLLEDIEQGFPAELRPDPLGQPSVTVAGRTVILGHPRPDQQAAMEQRVLDDFCGHQDCQRITAAAEESGPIPLSAVRINPLWTFTESGPVCSNSGIEIHFQSTRNLAMLRGICEEFLQEAALLGAGLARQRHYGVQIDWDAIRIIPVADQPEQLVHLNAAGDSLLLTLPLLKGAPDLLAAIRPWLSAVAAGEDPPRLLLDAGDYGWAASP